jgi:hypothetical protein
MRKTKKGQSTIEFIFVFFAFIVFLSLSYNAVVSFAIYQYFSYANFMAARAYQPSRNNRLDQNNAAVSTMGVYIPGIKIGSQNTPFSFSPSRVLANIKSWDVPRPDSPNLPMVLEFEVPFLVLPIGDDLRQSFGTLRLKTSMHIGREPSKEECRKFFVDFFGAMGGGAPHSPDAMEDNGC